VAFCLQGTSGKDSGPLNTAVKVPILIPDSQEWSSEPTVFYGQKHFDVVKGIAQTALNISGAGWFMTLCNSHQ
jgi:platelet-activating factor acetylhydrolase